jgi:tetratricopeptide (TPR) repeat protein
MTRSTLHALLHTGLITVAMLALTEPGTAQTGTQHQGMHHQPMPRQPLKVETKPFAPPSGASGAAVYDDLSDVPLWPNLGTISYPVTSASPIAQRYFDQGLRLAYGFNHAEARRAFRKAQQIDPTCAMCYWGEALVLGPNINAPMEPDAAAPAMAAVTRARALAANARPHEQALIEALAQRYAADPATERRTLDGAYAEAMMDVAKRYPDDNEITVLTAESLMDLSPWDYWQAGGTQPKGHTAEIIRMLEGVMKRNPDHIGAIHYYIHMVEASDRPERAVPGADRLASFGLEAGHLVHMPSHIYYRVGRYLDSLAANRRAVAADEAYLESIGTAGIYPGAYYPHNIHFLMASAQMAGDGPTAVTSAEKLQATVTAESARTVPWVQPIMAAPYFAHAQFSKADVVKTVPAPADEFPFVKAMWHYARGVAQATAGDAAAAGREAESIATLERTADFSGLEAAGVPASTVLELARHVVQARIAQAQGKLDTAIAEFTAAAELENRLPYMEPPFWYYPVQQSLGAVLLQAGRVDQAEQAFATSLTRSRNNGWALFGLMKVHEARGDQEAAKEAAANLERAWAGDRDLLDLARL